MSNYALSSLTPKFLNKDINVKIKARIGLEPYYWQISVIVNIIHYNKDVFIIIGTNAGTYQSISKITEGIILVISLTIILIKN